MSSIVAPAARRGPGFSSRRSSREMSRHRIVNPPELGAPSGFSHAVVASGRTVHLAGQIGAGTTLAEQFDDAAGRLLTALRAAGGEPEDLVSLQVFVTDVAAYKAALPELGPVWREHFGRHYPAMGLFGVRELFEPAAQVELMGVAVLPG
jgi:enamine deaminase RidA (YjgF/YER057c/UK114 family)